MDIALVAESTEIDRGMSCVMLARLRLEPDTCRDPRRLKGTPGFGPSQGKGCMLSHSYVVAVIARED